jgi:prepilin-type N-terminal cleavage/methylation domain-containing protein
MKARGFTLIEVLLAMILLSIVMYVGSLSFSIFSERWRKDMGGFNADVSDARRLLLLRQVLHGAANYLVRDIDDRAVYLFYGDAKQLVFVSNSPILRGGQQALIRLTVETLENGQQQLKYSESAFIKQPVFQLSALPESTDSVVLLQSENIRFNYFGWQSFAARVHYTESYQGSPNWQVAYDAKTIGVLPFAVNLTWATNEPLIFSLPHDNRTNNANVYDERDEA